jgi:uncharacterized protein (DUF58 family)
MKKWKQAFKIAFKGILLIILLASTFAYAMFQGGFVSWFLFYSFVPFALYSFLLLLYPFRDFKVERIIDRSNVKAGDHVPVTIRMTRSFPFPLFYMVVEDILPSSITDHSECKPVKKIIFPWFRKTIELSYLINHIPRGEHLFRVVRCTIGDPLQLIEREKMFSYESHLLVYPSFVEMVYRPLESRYDQGMVHSTLRIQRDTSLVTGVREYQPGDRVSWIHWKAFAKKNELMTKEFEEKRSHDVWLLLNREQSEAFELLVKFAASVTRAVLKHGAQLGVYSVGEEYTILPLNGGDEQKQKVFYHLAKVKDNFPDSFQQVIRSFQQEVPTTVSVLILTTSMTPFMIKEFHRFTSVGVFLIKRDGEPLKREEKIAMNEAKLKGMLVKVLREHDFSHAFAEVKNA